MEQIFALLTANLTSNYVENFAGRDEKIDQTEVRLKS